MTENLEAEISIRIKLTAASSSIHSVENILALETLPEIPAQRLEVETCIATLRMTLEVSTDGSELPHILLSRI